MAVIGMGCILHVRYITNAVFFNKKYKNYDKVFRTKIMAYLHLFTISCDKVKFIRCVIINDGRTAHIYVPDSDYTLKRRE